MCSDSGLLLTFYIAVYVGIKSSQITPLLNILEIAYANTEIYSFFRQLLVIKLSCMCWLNSLMRKNSCHLPHLVPTLLCLQTQKFPIDGGQHCCTNLADILLVFLYLFSQVRLNATFGGETPQMHKSIKNFWRKLLWKRTLFSRPF